MNNIEKVTIKTSDLTQNIDPEFVLDVINDWEKYINEFQDSLKIFNSEFRKGTVKDLKKALYFSLRDIIKTI